MNKKCSPGEKLKQVIRCKLFSEPECWFNFSGITSQTIDLFPKCDYVCGIVTLNHNTDVSTERLKSAFSELEYIKGALHVENTSFTDLAFFQKLRSLNFGVNGMIFQSNQNYIFCSVVISIINNSQLTDNKLLYQVGPFVASSSSLIIANNTKLDVGELCEHPAYQKFVEKMYVAGNWKDCGKSLKLFSSFLF